MFIHKAWINLKTVTNKPSLSMFTASRSIVTGNMLCISNKEKESWGTPPEKMEIPEHEWKSMFHYFEPKKGISIDFVHRLQKGYDISPQGFKNWYLRKKEEKNKFTQTYMSERVQALGFDLAAAHFIVFRGGRVQFKGAKIWTSQDEDGEYTLPGRYQEGIHIEALDASGTTLVYEGFECLSNLRFLKRLSLSTCPLVDDWCIDRLCGQYANTLEHLDLSHCRGVTENGISALARLRNLKTLNLEGMDHVKNIQILCVLLEENNSNLSITGLDFLNERYNNQHKENQTAAVSID